MRLFGDRPPKQRSCKQHKLTRMSLSVRRSKTNAEMPPNTQNEIKRLQVLRDRPPKQHSSKQQIDHSNDLLFGDPPPKQKYLNSKNAIKRLHLFGDRPLKQSSCKQHKAQLNGLVCSEIDLQNSNKPKHSMRNQKTASVRRSTSKTALL